jgi:hypothetical protein
MNAVEIEQAVSDLFAVPLDPAEFPYSFLRAFGNKETTLKKLRTGDTNKSDVGGVLQRNNIHIAVATVGQVSGALAAIRESPATSRHKVKFILATDGERVEAEELGEGTPLECAWGEFPDHFGIFLPLAGITTVREIRDNAFDIRATSKLNRLYIELLKDNPEWGTDERRREMNHFMARLIFSYFAEDTGIFADARLFTGTVSQMSESDSSNTHEVIGALFLAMNTKREARREAGIPRWADSFPYVNGGLFSGDAAVPRFSRTARSYLLQVGSLDWKQINPDIFGSMIQAVADDEERGALGMHYTSVPNILKVLYPLFLDELRTKLEEAGSNSRKLLNLRNRIKRIRVFDPACGSGNFLVIAYKELRRIEHEINCRRGETGRRSEIPLTNFRGIELRDFAAEIARLALIIAEFQCDVLYRGQQEALSDFLPLGAQNWITCGNALRIDWATVCPPTGKSVKVVGDGFLAGPLEQSEGDFEHAGGETYICGNPPFSGTRKQSAAQKDDLESIFATIVPRWKNVDYVGGWFLKAADYASKSDAFFAFVATNSICQGQQVAILWRALRALGFGIRFAVMPFKWRNLAKGNAGVTVVVVGLDNQTGGVRTLLEEDRAIQVEHINPYLTVHDIEHVAARRSPLSCVVPLEYGVYYSKSAGLLLTPSEARFLREAGVPNHLLRLFLGSDEYINGKLRYCLWIPDEELSQALQHRLVAERIAQVRADRLATIDKAVNRLAERAHQFREFKGDADTKLIVPIVSSEERSYYPVGFADSGTVPTNKVFFANDAPIYTLALVASRLHLCWIGTVCGRLEMRFSYSNTLGWNTFPVPPLSEQNKADLTRCAEEILMARESHYPATIADLYDPELMPSNLREAHEHNDEVLERIYIGRRFRNDSERLEKLFEMYTKMTANEQRRAGGESRRVK